MPEIIIDNLTEEQALVAGIFINEGKIQAFEELLQVFEEEHYRTGTEDPYYAYYVKYVIDILKSKIVELSGDEQA